MHSSKFEYANLFITHNLFPDKPLNNEVLNCEFRSQVSDKKPIVSNAICDKNTKHHSINTNQHHENSKRQNYDSKLTKETFTPLKTNLSHIESKHDDLLEKSRNDNVQDEGGEIEEHEFPENESALKQIESMMGRNYSDFMRSLASKYNKE